MPKLLKIEILEKSLQYLKIGHMSIKRQLQMIISILKMKV